MPTTTAVDECRKAGQPLTLGSNSHSPTRRTPDQQRVTHSLHTITHTHTNTHTHIHTHTYTYNIHAHIHTHRPDARRLPDRQVTTPPPLGQHLLDHLNSDQPKAIDRIYRRDHSQRRATDATTNQSHTTIAKHRRALRTLGREHPLHAQESVSTPSTTQPSNNQTCYAIVAVKRETSETRYDSRTSRTKSSDSYVQIAICREPPNAQFVVSQIRMCLSHAIMLQS